jgi:hypothetical protein
MMSNNCSAILAGGVFDTVVVDVTKSLDVNVLRYFEQETYEKYTKDVDAGLKLTIPIAKIPIGADGKYTEKGFQELKEKIRNQEITTIDMAEQIKIVTSTASEVIANAWLACIGTGLQGELSVSEEDEGTITFACRYLPNHVNDAPPTVTSFQVVGATYQEKSIFAVGSEVPYAGASLLLAREEMSAVSVALNTTKGEVTDSVTGPTPPSPPLPSVKIEIAGVREIGRVLQFEAEVGSGVADDYRWEFGDGNTASGKVVSHTYKQAGSFTVKVVASNDVSKVSDLVPLAIAYPKDWLLYGQKIRLQNGFRSDRWLTGARTDGNDEAFTLDVSQESDEIRTTYAWIVMKGVNEAGSGPVRYGDRVFLKCDYTNRSDRWLTGARTGGHDEVGTRDVRGESALIRTTYQWIVMKAVEETGSGILKNGEKIYLKNAYSERKDRWLTGARGSGNKGVGTRDVTREGKNVRNTYIWAVKKL